jgi:hypothetical protein
MEEMLRWNSKKLRAAMRSGAWPGALNDVRPASAGAQRREQVAARRLVERVEVDRAITLVAQHLDQGRTALFLRRLELAIGHPQELHLEGLDEKIFGIPAVRTRKRQN